PPMGARASTRSARSARQPTTAWAPERDVRRLMLHDRPMDQDTTRSFRPLCPAKDIPPGATRDFAIDAEHSVLVANCDGVFHAIEDRCSHDDGPLAEGMLIGCLIECPRHGARFDMETGKARTLPAVRGV